MLEHQRTSMRAKDHLGSNFQSLEARAFRLEGACG